MTAGGRSGRVHWDAAGAWNDCEEALVALCVVSLNQHRHR
jgi:hypothetical protein